jgi:hypothetical protein
MYFSKKLQDKWSNVNKKSTTITINIQREYIKIVV